MIMPTELIIFMAQAPTSDTEDEDEEEEEDLLCFSASTAIRSSGLTNSSGPVEGKKKGLKKTMPGDKTELSVIVYKLVIKSDRIEMCHVFKQLTMIDDYRRKGTSQPPACCQSTRKQRIHNLQHY